MGVHGSASVVQLSAMLSGMYTKAWPHLDVQYVGCALLRHHMCTLGMKVGWDLRTVGWGTAGPLRQFKSCRSVRSVV